jgi:hypothetical protein
MGVMKRWANLAEGWRQVKRWPLLIVTGMSLAMGGCGSQEEPDASVAVAISATTEMPFHGPGGPGTEPSYLSLRWTVVVTAAEGAESDIGIVRTRVTERASGIVLTAEGGPLGLLPGRGRLELPQQVSGMFASSLYPGDWTGITTVEVRHASGRSETLTGSFAFR